MCVYKYVYMYVCTHPQHYSKKAELCVNTQDQGRNRVSDANKKSLFISFSRNESYKRRGKTNRKKMYMLKILL